MNKIKIGKQEYYYPSSYDEVENRAQLLRILDIIDQPITLSQAKSQVLEVFLPINKIMKDHPKLYVEEVQTLRNESKLKLTQSGLFKYQLLETVDFIKTLDISKNVLEYISMFGKKYYQPLERLENITLGQWANAHLSLFFYTHKKEAEDLHKLIATLYCYPGENFKREDFNKKVHRVAFLPELVKKLCLVYISRNWEQVTMRFQNSVFKRSEEAEAGNMEAPSPPNWNKIIFALANDDITRLEEVGNQPLYTTLLFLEENHRKIEELKHQNL